MEIPLFKIYWDEDDIKAVSDALKRGRDWALGPNIEEFEKLIAQYIGIKHAVVFNSGGSALHALLISYGISKDDEIIVPSFSFICTANAPLYVGAKPIFADIEEISYGLDPEDVRKKITEKTKAIMSMHYGGAVCLKIKELSSLAKEKGILLIEDAAESFGAKLGDQKAGSFGDAAMFSFCQTKVFTTGEGGCIITNSDDIYEKLKLIRSYGRDESGLKYVSLGYNFRMSDALAALGISQIKKVDKLISIRREKAEYLTKILSGIKQIIIPEFPEEIFHVYQEYHIRAESRDALKKHLTEKGIGTRISFPPIHLTDYYKNTLGYNISLPKTEKIVSETLTLPLYPDLSEQEMDYITQQIKNFYTKN
ncbi:MAG: aminotransferase DegT [Candidatus Nealsonbacteria bacterium RBG_13_37_56]|uniref:Aminotransferase DegT n=1 Tax=Candidatus Nealsonbacteria bacterium RBG_13_37_56 TaxID=1801661 RepID=A0A1G2DW30_9BACT|nr:MAG: aminotransferase DegT [Candidatus Nealsonbacteria bacterium RBG_13_37_56]